MTFTVLSVGAGNDAFIPLRATSLTAATPAAAPGVTPTPTNKPVSSECTAAYPCLTPAANAAETILPIINLRQLDFWQAVATGQGRPGAQRVTSLLVRRSRTRLAASAWWPPLATGTATPTGSYFATP